MPRRKKPSVQYGGDPVLDAPVVATLDLHGMIVAEATVQLRNFLTSASQVKRGKVVRVITGRGRGSERGAVLRPAVARLLKGPLALFVADYSIDADEGSYLVLLK
jgi:DNA-nicking Smr family endonuclease